MGINNISGSSRKDGDKNAQNPAVSLITLKLAVALQLKQEGYVEIVFDKPVEAYGKKVKVHVFAEDEIGARVVVWCITKASQIKYDYLAEIFDIIKNELGSECIIAIAMPISLIGYVDGLIGLTYRIYMLDLTGKIWVHDAVWPRTRILPVIELMKESSDGVMESKAFPSHQATSNFYIA